MQVLSGKATNSSSNPDWDLDRPLPRDRTFPRRINFRPPFQRPPNVLLALEGFDIAQGEQTSFRVQITDIRRGSFSFEYIAPQGTLVNSASISWIAVASPPMTGREQLEVGVQKFFASLGSDKFRR